MALRPLLAALAALLLADGRRLGDADTPEAAPPSAGSLLDASRAAFPVAPWLHLARLSPAARDSAPGVAPGGWGAAPPCRWRLPPGRCFVAPASPEPAEPADGRSEQLEQSKVGAAGPSCVELPFSCSDGVRLTGWFPVKWADRFEPGSIRLLRVGLGIATFSAQLAVDVKTSVMVKLLQKHSRQGKHELEISDRMRALHLVEEKNFTNILSDFERYVDGEWTYMLLEAPDHDLDTLLKTHHIPMPDIPARKSPSDLDADVESRRGNFAHSMSQSLLVIIDLLRGVRQLEAAGMVHANLSPENILILGQRAVIGGLGDVCLLAAEDVELGLASVADFEGSRGFVSSVMLQPPEVRHGAPRSSQSSVWTIGLVYAWLRFGYNPAERVALLNVAGGEADEVTLREMDKDFESRRQLRDVLWRHFRIDFDPSFHRLGDGERRLLRGMLWHDAEARWDSAEAWRRALALAAEAGVRVPPEREPPELPDAWPSAVIRPEPPREAVGVGVLQGAEAWQ